MLKRDNALPQDKARDKRLPKQFGDFAESLVMYLLGRHKGARVALVDHVGADIIATVPDSSARYAISVKGRNFPASESKGFNFSQHDIDMLRDFAASFELIPAVAFVFADDMDGKEKVRVFVVCLDDMERLAADDECSFFYTVDSRTTDGLGIRYARTSKYDRLADIRACGTVDYTELTFDVLDGTLKL